MMKKKHTFLMVVGALSLMGIATTAIAAEGKAVTPPEVAVSETLTATVQVQAVDLKNRQLTLKNQEGDIFYCRCSSGSAPAGGNQGGGSDRDRVP